MEQPLSLNFIKLPKSKLFKPRAENLFWFVPTMAAILHRDIFDAFNSEFKEMPWSANGRDVNIQNMRDYKLSAIISLKNNGIEFYSSSEHINMVDDNYSQKLKGCSIRKGAFSFLRADYYNREEIRVPASVERLYFQDGEETYSQEECQKTRFLNPYTKSFYRDADGHHIIEVSLGVHRCLVSIEEGQGHRFMLWTPFSLDDNFGKKSRLTKNLIIPVLELDD